MLDPRRLLTFREVARLGSFSRAGEALALTQPAVSQQVAALERQLATRLLDRGPGGPTTTEAGALLLEHADAVAERLAQADAQLGELVAAERETLRVGAHPSAIASVVPKAIVRLHRDRPELQVEAYEGSADDIGRRVAVGDLHIGMCFQDAAMPPRRPEGTDRHELGGEGMMAVLPPDHPLAGRDRIGLIELADETWTAPSREHMIYRACVIAGFEPRIPYVARDPLTTRALVADGLAVSLMPELLAGRVPGVAFVALSEPAPKRSLYALTPEAGTRPVALTFLAALRDATTAAIDRPTA
jgi:DNA-binding transcriptional LysR family regulator